MHTVITATGKEAKLKKDGKYRIFAPGLGGFNSISALWSAPDVPPSGILSFSLDGDPGMSPELSQVDLSQTGEPGSRSVCANTNLAYIDVELAGMSPCGVVTIYLR